MKLDEKPYPNCLIQLMSTIYEMIPKVGSFHNELVGFARHGILMKINEI